MSGENRTVFRTCPLCEATCGLEITVGPNEQIVRIRGDKDDVFSKGFICPKGSTLKQLHEDPDRLRKPLVKRNGVHVEVSWEEAFAAVNAGLTGVIEKHGRQALSIYAGNPCAHHLAPQLYNSGVYRSSGTHNKFSASTVDQIPKHVAGGYMFGTPSSIPIPDIDHTDFFMMLGANPYASNGSLCTAPDFPGRIQAIRARGGKVVVVDPRNTKTAQESDEWISIRPGTDGLFLAAIINTLFAEGRTRIPAHLSNMVNGVEELRAAVSPFTPAAVEAATGVSAETIVRIARELSDARTAVTYGRIGVNTVSFGTVNAWLVDALNVVSGNIDTRGGAMFPLPAHGGPTVRTPKGGSKGFTIGRGHSRVRKYPEAMGEYPVAALAEEILTPGEGRIRALITIGGNPVLSTPNSNKLDEAFADLEFMVSVDIYLNETTRQADVILPPPSALERDHYDMGFYALSVRNIANFSSAVFPMKEGAMDEWEILAKLTAILQGLGPDVDASVIDEYAVRQLIGSAVGSSDSPISGRDPEEIFALASSNGRVGPTRMLDVLLQTGPYGAGFGANPNGLSVDKLIENPHGIDLGPLESRLPEALRTASGKVELAPELFLNDLHRLRASMDNIDHNQILLVGRRDLKSNNSWMHNMKVLTKGSLSCTLHVNPADAARLGLETGRDARITSRVGEVVVPVEVTDAVRQGVVSMPHGWGHNMAGTRLAVAAEKPGVNSNILTDEEAIDPLSGNAVLSAIPVTVVAA
jgi:anaerobic selenocysteine-containing dehydrogenase